MKILVGNDIVDLKNLNIALKHNEKRFLERVLAPYEQELLQNARDKKVRLWTIWSGKEAAYKVLKKRFPDLVFSHSKFTVSFDENKKKGIAQYEDAVVSLRWNSSEDWVHCVAVEQENEKRLDVLEYDIKPLDSVSASSKNFNTKELLSIHSSESIGARNLTKALLSKHIVEEVRIVRHPLSKKFSPPELYLSEIPLKNWDISMSHDGRFVACAVSRHGTLSSLKKYDS